MLRDYGCVFCSLSLLSFCMCVRMPPSLRSIAGVPSSSSQALPSYLITAHHLCAFLLYLARWLCVGITRVRPPHSLNKMWHSDVTLESTVPGTRLIVASCPPVTFIVETSSNTPSFVWWFSSSPRIGHFTTHPKLSKNSNVRRKIIFGVKSLTSLVRILR